MPRPKRICSVEGCSRPHLSLGYCRAHYWRFKKTGDVGEAAIRPTRRTLNADEWEHGVLSTYNNHRCRCEACTEANRQYWRKHKLLKRLGDLDVAKEKLEEQGYVCDICHEPESRTHYVSGKPYELCLDHDHATGAARSYLCSCCNFQVGRIEAGREGPGHEYYDRCVAYLDYWEDRQRWEKRS